MNRKAPVCSLFLLVAVMTVAAPAREASADSFTYSYADTFGGITIYGESIHARLTLDISANYTGYAAPANTGIALWTEDANGNVVIENSLASPAEFYLQSGVITDWSVIGVSSPPIIQTYLLYMYNNPDNKEVENFADVLPGDGVLDIYYGPLVSNYAFSSPPSWTLEQAAPTPEPSTMLLLASGLISLGGFKLRKGARRAS